jgi:hypothetical protein
MEIRQFQSPWLRVLLQTLIRGSGLFAVAGEAAAAGAAVNAYLSEFSADDVIGEPDPLQPELAAVLVRAVLDLDEVVRERFFAPLDFAARARALETIEEDGRFGETSKLKQLLRTHIRLLCRAIIGWTVGSRPTEILEALHDTLVSAVRDDFAHGKVGAFDAFHEMSLNYTGSFLAKDLGVALRLLDANEQRKFVDVLADLTEPAALAALAQNLEGNHRNELLVAAAGRIDEAPELYSLNELHARIEVLLDASLLEEAERLLSEEPHFETLGNVPDRGLWRFSVGLRLAFEKREFERIAKKKIPDDLEPGNKRAAEEWLKFYQALAELEREGGALDHAESVFVSLRARHPKVSAYAINLHAVRVKRAVPPELMVIKSAQQRREIERILAEGDEAMAEFRYALRMNEDETYECNRILLRFALGQFDAVLRDLEEISEIVVRSERLWSYRIIALAKSGRQREASALLEDGARRFGAEFRRGSAMQRARKVVEENAAVAMTVLVAERPARLVAIRVAFAELRSLTPEEQSSAVMAETLHDFLCREMREACSQIRDLAPFVRMPGDKLPQEDVVTKLLCELLVARFRWLGWSLHLQDPGGHTGGNKVGERDLIIKKDGVDLAVFEAVRITSVETTELRDHFQKLFGYGVCEIKFLVVWSFASHPDEVLRYIERMVEEEAPKEFSYQRKRSIQLSPGDSMLPGIISFHRWHGGTVKVVHLVVDLRQEAERNAAVLARKRG